MLFNKYHVWSLQKTFNTNLNLTFVVVRVLIDWLIVYSRKLILLYIQIFNMHDIIQIWIDNFWQFFLLRQAVGNDDCFLHADICGLFFFSVIAKVCIFCGYGIGVILSGFLSDRLGRRAAMSFLSQLIFGSGIMATIMPDIASFCFMWFIVGNVAPLCTVYISSQKNVK
jgi:hypothetical protein